jgi:hypothetical protein
MAREKKGRSDKSPAVKGAVVAKHGGVSARPGNLSSTVIGILSETEIESFVQQGGSDLYELFLLRGNTKVESRRT